MSTPDFTPTSIWSTAGVNTKPPSSSATQANFLTGFECGEANPEHFNWLFNVMTNFASIQQQYGVVPWISGYSTYYKEGALVWDSNHTFMRTSRAGTPVRPVLDSESNPYWHPVTDLMEDLRYRGCVRWESGRAALYEYGAVVNYLGVTYVRTDKVGTPNAPNAVQPNPPWWHNLSDHLANPPAGADGVVVSGQLTSANNNLELTIGGGGSGTVDINVTALNSGGSDDQIASEVPYIDTLTFLGENELQGALDKLIGYQQRRLWDAWVVIANTPLLAPNVLKSFNVSSVTRLAGTTNKSRSTLFLTFNETLKREPFNAGQHRYGITGMCATDGSDNWRGVMLEGGSGELAYVYDSMLETGIAVTLRNGNGAFLSLSNQPVYTFIGVIGTNERLV